MLSRLSVGFRKYHHRTCICFKPAEPLSAWVRRGAGVAVQGCAIAEAGRGAWLLLLLELAGSSDPAGCAEGACAEEDRGPL